MRGIIELYDGWFKAAIIDIADGKLTSTDLKGPWLEDARKTLLMLAEARMRDAHAR